MKKCEECKRKVSGAQWSYQNDLCRTCGARNRYRNNNPELKELLKLTKKELFTKVIHLKIANKRLNDNMAVIRGSQIRHFRNRLYKIRNSIDYLLKHPFSVDTSIKTKKHNRDRRQK